MEEMRESWKCSLVALASVEPVSIINRYLQVLLYLIPGSQMPLFTI